MSTSRDDWNSRVATNPLLWMAEGIPSEDAFRESAERDFNSLISDLSPEWLARASLLDIGCGVGRLLLPAVFRVASVTGADVANQALLHATARCKGHTISLVALNGKDLSALTGPFDIAISFAALVHLTPITLATYLHDLYGLLRDNGIARLQLYIGDERQFTEQDTFSIRSYEKMRLLEVCLAAGFRVTRIMPVPLPFDGRDHTLNRDPVIFALEKVTPFSPAAPATLAAILTRERGIQGEPDYSKDEYGVVMREVNRGLKAGDLTSALALLQYWNRKHPVGFPEVVDAIEKITVAIKT